MSARFRPSWQVYDFLGLPPHSVADISPRNTRKYNAISETTRRRLSRFYAPFNQQLFDLLDRQLAWGV
jgi:hypothetical protein